MIEPIFNGILYAFLFVSLYFEVFLLITFFEERAKIAEADTKRNTKLSRYPTATIIVPCWNEEKTVSKTIHSLLRLDYPKNKFNIFIVDDGSTDRTWEVIQKFSNNPQVTLIHKENGGKHTAVNLGIQESTSDIIGCLDADSYVDKDALREIARTFNEDPEVMAAIPTIIIHEPKTVFQKMQKTEYHMVAFFKRMLSPLDAITVTPGPFSFFRKEVFQKIGLFKSAYNTEDLELALRMQSHHMRIRNIHSARVYTSGPDTLYKLYRQRLRWAYGGLKNSLDYRFMMFQKKYGILGMITLPLAFFGIFIFLYNSGFFFFHVAKNAFEKIAEISITGLSLTTPNFDSFFINTDFMVLIAYTFFGLALVIMWNGVAIAEGRFRPSMGIFYFIALYGIVAPIWLARAVINFALSRGTSWR